MNRRQFLQQTAISAAALGLCTAGASPAMAQKFPVKPVRILVGYPAGLAPDVITRLVAEGLSQMWRQPVLVENRPGASGILAMNELKKSKSEGYDYVFGDVGNMAINSSYYRSLPYDPEKDLVPVVDLLWVQWIFFVSRDSPFKSMNDLIAQAKAHPGKYTYASTGTGSPMFGVHELLKLRAGINLQQVAFRDQGQLLTTVANGEVTLLASSMATARPVIDKLRPLAVAAKERQAAFLEIPTVEESGGPRGFDVTAWGFFATLRGTPAPILEKVRADAMAVMQRPEVRARAESLGFTLSRSRTQQELEAFIKSEITAYREVINATGARAD
jgi:tripartite-type tricarboxylate transporter receptor subunit TctC